ncbi:MAG: DUF4331 family protein [Pyrinomonadaceae bacterium]
MQARNQGLNQGAGRDTYSGFSTLAIALSVPSSMLRGAATSSNRQGNQLGLNGQTQRRRNQIVRTDGQVVGSGAWVTVDREGVPLVNNGLIPAPRKDEYNGAPTTDDASGRFRADIIQSLHNFFGTNEANIALLLNMIQVQGRYSAPRPQSSEHRPGGGNNTSGGPGQHGRASLAG